MINETHEHENIYSEINEKELYEIYKLSLDENYKEWHKRAFESEFVNIYDIKSLNNMNRIHDNKSNHISEFNLLHDILNTSIQT